MKILVACEFSGTVRDAFLKKGHDAISCDILEGEGGGPHYQGDIRDILYNGWTSDVDDYVYLKAGGNSTSNHGIIAISDNGGFFVGNTNTETGASKL